MFFGSTFSGSSTAISNSTAVNSNIVSFEMTNMIIDEMYATKKVLLKFDWNIPQDWDFNTLLHAQYKGNTLAGNLDYSESVVDKIRIKKRYKGDFEWKTIYEKDIRSNEDFFVELYDYYEPSNRIVEYLYVALIANIEMNTSTVSAAVKSEFDCYFICDRDRSYAMPLDTANNITFNRESKTIVSPGRKYPYVVNNGIARYYSGSLKTTFIELNDSDLDYDVDNGWSYRNGLDEFLANGEPKILKSFEGDMWMVNVIGNLARTENGHYQNISHQIDWVECGDPNSVADLYDNNFIDTDFDRK